jgi:thiamine-monophosphate kinase
MIGGMTDEIASGEDRLIARHFAPLATHPGAFGLVDDAAAVAPPPGCDLVLKTDAIVGGVQFFENDPAGAVAQKALRVNLSDLAAKGATPLGFLLSIALPKGISESWLAAFSDGLKSDIDEFKCPLFGGDTVKSPGAVMISVTVIGSVPTGTMVKRGGAKVGDRIVVTGTIGDAALGLKLRQDDRVAVRWKLDAAAREHLAQRYLVPQPRNVIAEVVRTHAHGGMDVSDGLAGDLTKMCGASGVSAEIDASHVPLSIAAKAALAAAPALIEPILTGGDDYEVLATIPPAKLDTFLTAARSVGVPVADIGVVTAGRDAPKFVWNGRQLDFARRSFSHF